MIARLAALAVIAATVLGCTGAGRATGGPTPGPANSGALRVVATTTILADFVRSVGGDRVTVTSLVPPGGEVHTFDPSPGDIARVGEAQLVVANGLGLDEWLTRLAVDSGTRAAVVHLADAVPTDRYIVEDGSTNPHLWLDPADAALYGTTIAAALARADPANAEAFAANARALAARLDALGAWARQRVATLPPDRRAIVSFHDALPYFARAFGFRIAGVIVSAPGQDPSAGEVAKLIDAIKASNVKVIVSEVQFSDKLARTIAAETGATVVSDLYTDTLGDPPVDTYEGLIHYDVDRLVTALGGGP